MKTLTWQKPGQQNVAQELIKIIINYVAELRIIKEAYKDIISYEYLCGLLNSQYLRNIYEQNVKEGGRVFPQVKLEKLKPLPIVIPTKEERKKVEDIVSQIIDLRSKSQDTEDLEVYLNQVVNKLYMK